MTYVTAPIRAEKTSVTSTVMTAFAAVFAGIRSYVVMFFEVKSRADEVQRLQYMSDRQLNDIGLKREDIARRVFGDMLFS